MPPLVTVCPACQGPGTHQKAPPPRPGAQPPGSWAAVAALDSRWRPSTDYLEASDNPAQFSVYLVWSAGQDPVDPRALDLSGVACMQSTFSGWKSALPLVARPYGLSEKALPFCPLLPSLHKVETFTI